VKKKSLLLILFVTLQKLYGADIQITDKNLEAYFTPEYNRAYYFCWDISTVSAVNLNNRHTIKTGLAMGAAGSAFDIKMFTSGETALNTRIPLYFSLTYKYNSLPEYEYHHHSMPLMASLKWKWAGFSLGCNFRLSSFSGEPPIFEPIPSASVYVFFINNDFLRLGLKSANFTDFTSGNLGAYFLNLNSVIRLNEKISLINEIEIRQSGSIALASNFYGLIYRGGAAFIW
jgi:hypothetical protein